ncbi:MAG: VOC family protein [Gammaproteobacteria bacterium]|nr:VOC family protein [Gammaproteobacteria bacterium]
MTSLFAIQPVFATPVVSPVSNEATDQFHPGKVIWIDLVTDDVALAASFYSQAFGWDITVNSADNFAEVSYQGQPVAAIAKYEKDAPDNEARWLVSISVPDVEATAIAVREHGGEVLEGPVDLPNRGRYVLVTDSTGAMLMFLQAKGGDPADEKPTPNSWLWAELWTDDPANAESFYKAVVGYESKTMREADGNTVMVLGRERVARASLVKIPFEDVEPNWLPYLLVDDIGKALKSVETHGGSVVLYDANDSRNADVAIVADPTGGVFALQQKEVNK